MTTINFPIFDQLLTMSNTYDKKLYTNKLLCKKINELEHNHKETIYLIVKLYMMKLEKSSPLSLPYEGKIVSLSGNESSIEFNLTKFPDGLVKVLNIFLKEIIKKK